MCQGIRMTTRCVARGRRWLRSDMVKDGLEGRGGLSKARSALGWPKVEVACKIEEWALLQPKKEVTSSPSSVG
eukprot:scaffold2540_cov153-Pinguiococcus_pyrenoidosus.AAC.2